MRRFIHTAILLAAYFWLIWPSYSQQREFPFRAFNVEDGLPQSFVSGLVQDNEGFIWIATRDGLAKYDGRKFKTFRYRHGDKTSLASNIISMLYLDKKDRLWIKYEQGDIDVLDTKTEILKHFSFKAGKSITKDIVKNSGSIAIDILGRSWLLDNDSDGVYIIGKNQKPIYRGRSELMPHITSNRITGIAAQGPNILLITDKALVFLDTNGKMVQSVEFKFPNGSLYNSNEPQKDNSPVIRRDGEIIIPDEGRLIVYSPKTSTFTVLPLPAQQVHHKPSTFLDEEDRLYLSYNNKIYSMGTDNTLAELSLHAHKVPKSNITSMILDKSGILWIGTNGYGLMQYDLRLSRMPKYDYKTNFHEEILKRLEVPDEDIKATFLYDVESYSFRWTEGKDRRIWMCRAHSYPVPLYDLCYYKNNKLVIPKWTYKGDTSGKYGISSLAVNRYGELWGIDYYLRPVFFNTENYTATTYKPLFDSKKEFNRIVDITGLIIDNDETFWLSSNFGLIRYVHGNKRKPYSFILPDITMTSLAQSLSDNDILWIGTYSDGLVEYHKSTGKAIYHTAKSGLPSDTIYGIIYDEKGNLWCSTNKGIFSFNHKTGQIRKYTSKDGLPADEFNRFAYFKFPDGHIAFGGTRGYTVFKPSSLLVDSFEPKTVITGIRINNEPANYSETQSHLKQDINSLDTLKLPYDKNFVSLEFAALEFNIPEKTLYRYMLEGLDEKWVMAGYDNTATYTTIPPGNYTFIVNATNSDGKWSNKIKKLTIMIAPPFWQTWWFIAICTLAAAGIISFLILQKVKSFRRQYRQKIEFERETMELEARALRSQMNPHFIFNCLSSINSLIRQNKNNEAVMYLSMFSRLIRNQLNNNSKEISLQDELETCRLYLQLESLRFKEKLEYSFIVPDDIDLGSLLVPPLIIQPFIENSIIHGILPLENAGRITVTVEENDGRIICCIDDNGIGREEAELNRKQRKRKHMSHGTNLIKSRVALHNRLSDCKVVVLTEDKKDGNSIAAGTRVTLTFTIDD